MGEDICIYSYNSRGFAATKQDVAKSMVTASGNNPSIICNQENFILKANGYIIEKCLPSHYIFFKPATKSGLSGRPKNGMFIAVPSDMKEYVTDVSPPSSRVQCILIESGNGNTLLVNTYFPTDPRTDNFDDNDLMTTLTEIRTVLNDQEFCRLLWAGDINTDFSRNTAFVRNVEDFIDELNLVKSWDNYDVDFTHCYEVNNSSYFSTIDHFFWNSSTTASITDAGVMHLSGNLSDHSPVYCKLKMELKRSSTTSTNRTPTPSWQKASEKEKDLYYNEVNDTLKNLSIPVCVTTCTNVHCTDETHKRCIDDLMIDILHSIEKSAENHIPTPKLGSNKRNLIPDWNSGIKPFQEKAQFWRAVWLSAGRPQQGQLFMLMKKTRNTYHLQIRKMKRIQNQVRRNNLLNCCLSNKGDLFDVIKKQRKCKQNLPTSMDDCKDDIPGYFADKYKKLYNSANDEQNLTNIEHQLSTDIGADSCNILNIITPELVSQAIKKLKPGKSDPLLKVTSDFFINSPEVLHRLLSTLMRSFIVHSHVSNFLLISTLVPIVKDKLASVTNSNNYRSIAISSLIMKIFDWVIIIGFKDFLNFDDLQFGYQPKVSTSMCTWLAVETISYFSRNGSDVFTCLMDMSKAFDNVQHSKLFCKLLEQGMPSIIVRFLLVSYRLQQANVRWNNEISRFFDITNGVKQGAVLSAVFYCIYTNGLLEELRRKKIGCCIGQNYVGVVGYADDLFLMSPTLDGLQKMLNVCDKFAKEHHLNFSTDANPNKSKTKCMAFVKKKRELRNLTLANNPLPWVDSGKHLGIKIVNQGDNLLSHDCKEKRARYIQRNNELMQEFAFADCTTKTLINNIYNSHFTGSVLWDQFGKDVEHVYKTWNVSIRKIYRLDRETHRHFIEPISGTPHIKTSFLGRFLRFTQSLSCSNKRCAQNVFHSLNQDCRSTTGRNLRMIANLTGKINGDDISLKDIAKMRYRPYVDEITESKIEATRELIDIRDAKKDLRNWNKEDVVQFIHFLTTA